MKIESISLTGERRYSFIKKKVQLKKTPSDSDFDKLLTQAIEDYKKSKDKK